MKIRSLTLVAGLTFLAAPALTAIGRADAPKATLPAAVYAENGDQLPWIPSGYMGSKPSAIKMTPDCTENPHAGKTCLKVEYTEGAGWGGVVWQSPANDWEHEKAGGWNLAGAKKFSFWARSAKGGEVVTFSWGGGGSGHPYPDSAGSKFDKVKLTTEWKEYSVDISKMDMSQIKTGFTWVLGTDGSPVTFYLDDIKYE